MDLPIGSEKFPCSKHTEGLIPGLPNEIAHLCLAKVSLSYRHAMRAVCTSWRDVFYRNEFWKARRPETLALFKTPNPHGPNVWHCFHPSTKDWIKLPPTPFDDGVKDGSASAVIDGKLFVVGGWCQNYKDASSAVFFFDMKHHQWKKTASLNITRAHFVVGVIQDRLYVCGGMTDTGPAQILDPYYDPTLDEHCWTSTAEVYDPASETWNLIASTPFPGRVLCGTVIDEKLCVTYHDQGVQYDPRSQEWSHMSDELRRVLQRVPVIFNGDIYVRKKSRPLHADGQRTLDIMKYETENRTWQLHRRVYEEEYPTSTWRDSGHELVILEQKLCIAYRHPQSDGILFVIMDLEKRLLACSRVLFLGFFPSFTFEHASSLNTRFEYQIFDL